MDNSRVNKIIIMKHICFYNKFHNGDIHVTRSFIRYIINSFPNFSYSYTHSNSSNLIKDINIVHDPKTIHSIKSDQSFVLGDTIFCCTWYGAYNKKYINKYSISFECLYHIFKDFLQTFLHHDISNIDKRNFIPSIDFSRFNIAHAKEFLDTTPGIRILICNGDTKSAQGYKTNMTHLITQLASKFPNITFFATNEPIKTNKNIIYTPDIIKMTGCDLNENAYIGSRCNLIIGQLSGAHTFCYNDMTLNNDSHILSLYRYTKNLKSYVFFDSILKKQDLQKKFFGVESKNYNTVLEYCNRLIGTIERDFKKK